MRTLTHGVTAHALAPKVAYVAGVENSSNVMTVTSREGTGIRAIPRLHMHIRSITRWDTIPRHALLKSARSPGAQLNPTTLTWELCSQLLLCFSFTSLVEVTHYFSEGGLARRSCMHVLFSMSSNFALLWLHVLDFLHLCVWPKLKLLYCR